MFNDLLKDYKEDDYVYIIDGCLNTYVSDEELPIDSEPCPCCGEYDWPVVDGYVKDIREAEDLDDYYEKEEAKALKLVPTCKKSNNNL